MIEQNTRKGITRAAKGWATFFAILLTFSLVLMLLSLALNYSIFDQAKFEQAMSEQDIYSQIPQVVVEIVKQSLLNQSQTEGIGSLFSQLNSEQMTRLIETLLPQDYIKNQTEQNLDSAYSFINLQSTDLSFYIDLQPVKENMNSLSGQTVFINYLNTFPECTADQLNEIMQSQLTEQVNVSFSLCKPPESWMQYVQPVIVASLQQFSAILPDQVSLLGQNQTELIRQITTSKPYSVYKLIREMMALTPWLVLILAVIIVLLTLRSARTMLKHLGSALLTGGLIASAMTLLMEYTGKVYLNSISASSGNLDTMFRGVANMVMLQFTHSGLVLCAIAFSLGLVFLLISKIIPHA